MHPLRPLVAAALAALVALAVSPLAAVAEPPIPSPPAAGRITGQVLDRDRHPIADASVRVLGITRGTNTDENGRFVLDDLPPGRYRLEAVRMDFTARLDSVEVPRGGAARLVFALTPRDLHVVDGTETRSHRRIDKGTQTVSHSDRAKIDDLPGVGGYADVVATVAGVVAQNGVLHVNGSRGDETSVSIDGMRADNPKDRSAPELATLAIASADVITGGFDASRGDALAGFIELSTREGPDSLVGEVRWDTDRYGDPTKTFNDFDRLSLALGGPTPMPGLTWFGTYEGTFSDTYLRASITKPHRTLLDFVQLGNRQNNHVNTNLKLAWRPHTKQGAAKDKITFEAIQNRSEVTPYEHMWSRCGFVKVSRDTNRTTGAVSPRYGTWSFRREDDSFVPMNLPDHVPTTENRFRSFLGVWTHTLSPNAALVTRLSSLRFDERTGVGAREPWEYDTQSPFYWAGNTEPGTENDPYYATHGDFPRWSRSSGSTAALKTDLDAKLGKSHLAKAGFEARYHRVSNLDLVAPNLESGGLPGQVRSEYDLANPDGAVYAQDRWEYENLVLNAGLRLDVFSPGSQVSDRDLPSGRRWKMQVSPRLGIAYPISDRDVLSFHYGWTYQTPPREAIFENRGAGATVQTRGNPDLEPETNISYQAAMQHLFSRDVAGTFTVYFKDIYGLLSVRQERDEFGNLVNVWSNGDYASSRGFEASLSRAFSHRFSADVSWAYQIATGVASDPSSALTFFNGGSLYLPISEQPLDWDQRQTLNVSAVVREPGRWGMRVLWTYGSGIPFTPAFRNDRRPDPALTNSRTLPASSRLTIDGDKYYRVWGQNLTVFFDARNVLDATTIASLVQSSFPNNNVDRSGASDYRIYYTETGRAGGAYLQDVNGDHVDDWVPVHDPRVFDEGRNVRVGVRLAF